MPLKSTSWFAEITGFDRAAVARNLKHIPYEKKGSSKLFETKEALPILYAESKTGSVELVDGMQPIDYERWRKLKAEATSQEMKNQVQRRELAPVKLLEFAISSFSEQANSVFESIPLKVKKRLPHLKATEIEIVKKEVVKVQNAASKITIDWGRLSDIN